MNYDDQTAALSNRRKRCAVMRRFRFIKYNSRKAVCPCVLSQQLSFRATGTPQKMIEQGKTITAGYLADHFSKRWDGKRRQIICPRSDHAINQAGMRL